VRKISIRNLFKKSESDTGKSKKSIILIILLIFIVAAGVFYWGYPLLFPDSSVKSPITSVTVTTPAPTKVTPKAEVKPIVKEKTEFEIEMEKREQGYKNKIFVYEPYEPPSNRNPFQKVRTSTFTEEIVKKEEGEEEKVLRFPKPELPPGTKLSGIIDSKGKKIAIIEMNGETYIANLYDIISEKYIVKEIKKDEVIIDFNGYFFSLKIGGEDSSDEL
jgi:hypothetical protein